MFLSDWVGLLLRYLSSATEIRKPYCLLHTRVIFGVVRSCKLGPDQDGPCNPRVPRNNKGLGSLGL